jgi:16S rRNA (guanine966-N2)-methyltransferase
MSVVREALFSILAARANIAGRVFWDLFAGTGAVAFEALSRGAGSAICVERSAKLARDLQEAARVLGVEDRTRVIQSDVLQFLRGQRLELPDIVFLDPPYNYSKWEEVAVLLPPVECLVVESRKPVLLGSKWETITTRRYGDSRLQLFRYVK